MPLFSVERSNSVHSALKRKDKTAAEKKVVHFADSMGLDLCQVRSIFPYNTSDDDLFGSTPPLPVSLQGTPSTKSTVSPRRPIVPRVLPHSGSFNHARFLHLHSPARPMWQDYSQVNKQLIAKAKWNGVCLKSSSVIGMTFSGIIACHNIAFQKQVHVRYTIDRWHTHTDISAHYVGSNSAENIDHFSFSIFLPQSIPVGARAEFCIRYNCGDQEFWDNNDGQNYILECKSMGETYGGFVLEEDLYEPKPHFY